MKFPLLATIAAGIACAASTNVDVYSPQDLHSVSQKVASQQKAGFASQILEHYPNHYTMLAFRERTGSSEIHQTEADIFLVTEGTATIVTGGKLVNSHTEKPNELRGTSVEGGTRHLLEKGSVIHIPAGVAHQLLIDHGPFTYFVVKVAGQ